MTGYVWSRNKRGRLTAGEIYDGRIVYRDGTPYFFCQDNSGKWSYHPGNWFVKAGDLFAKQAQKNHKTQTKRKQEELQHDRNNHS